MNRKRKSSKTTREVRTTRGLKRKDLLEIDDEQLIEEEKQSEEQQPIRLPSIHQIMQDCVNQDKLPELAPHMKRFVFDYISCEWGGNHRTQEDWSKRYNIHKQTLYDWLHREDVKAYLAAVTSGFDTYVSEMLPILAQETVRNIHELLTWTIDDNNLEMKRKLALDLFALMSGRLPKADGEDRNELSQFDEVSDKSIDEIRRDLDETELLLEGIDDDDDYEAIPLEKLRLVSSEKSERGTSPKTKKVRAKRKLKSIKDVE